jgi:hypothetical protein
MAGYIGTTPVPQATQHRESFTATGGQTSFATAGYTPQFIDVYLNGVKLAPADYTATNGSDVVLASGATASDILEIVAYTPFEVANQTFTGDTSVTNLAVIGTFTSRGIDDNADAVAITIDSSENVGIGFSNPDAYITDNNSLVVKGQLRVQGVTNTAAVPVIGVRDDNTGFYLPATNTLGITTNSSERMRIDSSGNVVVGKTTAGDTGAGVTIQGVGKISAVRDGGISAKFVRETSDGSIVEFVKDTTTVGTIGTRGGHSYIGSGDTALKFLASADAVVAATAVDGSGRADAIDLGQNGNAFKDLYLSGGVYLGGTGAANKLDDYEEGTWTPTGNGITYSSAFGSYVKVGRLVMITFNVTFPSTSDTNSARIESLPFTVTTGNAYQSGAYVTASDAGTIIDDTYFTISTSRLLIRNNGNGDRDNNQYSAKFIQGSAVYMTD